MFNKLLLEETSEVKKFNSIDWVSNYENIDVTEEDRFIDDFIQSFLVAHDISTNIGFRSALKAQLKSYAPEGFRESNPFLEWMIKYDSEVKGLDKINDESYNNLIDTYSKGIILDEDLRGTSSLGTKSLIFTKDLFNKNNQDFIYLNQVFYYSNGNSGSKNILDKINNMTEDQFKDFLDRLGSNSFLKKDLTQNNLKYFLSFEEEVFDIKGKLRNSKNIYNALSYLDNKVQSSKDRDNDIESMRQEAYDALKIVGFKDLEIRAALNSVKNIDIDTNDFGEFLKIVLRRLRR